MQIRRVFHIGTILAGLIGLAVVFQNCGETKAMRYAELTEDMLRAQQTKSVSQIKQLAAADLSCNTDQDCLSLRYHPEPCEEEDVIASNLNPELAELNSAIEEVNARTLAFSVSKSIACTMEYRARPVASCLQNLCVQSGYEF